MSWVLLFTLKLNLGRLINVTIWYQIFTSQTLDTVTKWMIVPRGKRAHINTNFQRSVQTTGNNFPLSGNNLYFLKNYRIASNYISSTPPVKKCYHHYLECILHIYLAYCPLLFRDPFHRAGAPSSSSPRLQHWGNKSRQRRPSWHKGRGRRPAKRWQIRLQLRYTTLARKRTKKKTISVTMDTHLGQGTNRGGHPPLISTFLWQHGAVVSHQKYTLFLISAWSVTSTRTKINYKFKRFRAVSLVGWIFLISLSDKHAKISRGPGVKKVGDFRRIFTLIFIRVHSYEIGINSLLPVVFTYV